MIQTIEHPQLFKITKMKTLILFSISFLTVWLSALGVGLTKGQTRLQQEEQERNRQRGERERVERELRERRQRAELQRPRQEQERKQRAELQRQREERAERERKQRAEAQRKREEQERRQQELLRAFELAAAAAPTKDAATGVKPDDEHRAASLAARSDSKSDFESDFDPAAFADAFYYDFNFDPKRQPHLRSLKPRYKHRAVPPVALMTPELAAQMVAQMAAHEEDKPTTPKLTQRSAVPPPLDPTGVKPRNAHRAFSPVAQMAALGARASLSPAAQINAYGFDPSQEDDDVFYTAAEMEDPARRAEFQEYFKKSSKSEVRAARGQMEKSTDDSVSLPFGSEADVFKIAP